jgi:acyl-CoA synthetase (AMP-forming)/AMP-acid ligase II
VGEIWVSGKSVASGYWNRGPSHQPAFDACLPGDAERYLRTGDLGFIHAERQSRRFAPFCSHFTHFNQTVGLDGQKHFPGSEFCRKLFLGHTMCRIL